MRCGATRPKLEKIAAAVESEVEDDRVIRAARNLFCRASAEGSEVWRSRLHSEIHTAGLIAPPEWMDVPGTVDLEQILAHIHGDG